MKTLYLCGAGNSEGVRLALTINRKYKRWDHIYVLDDDVSKVGQSRLGVEIVGPFSTLKDCDPGATEVCNLVARTCTGRWGARSKIADYGIPFAPLINPDVDTEGVAYGQDILAYQNATLGPEVSLGEASVVFMGAVVGHESQVGQCCVVAANAVLNARVELGDGVYVGTNASILPEITIGPWATIGAGSVVLQDVPAGTTVMGVPAIPLFATNVEGPRDSHTVASTGAASGAGGTEPQTEVEQTLFNIWKKAFNRNDLSIHDSFLDLGGDSLMAVNMVFAIREAFQVDVPLNELFEAMTVSKLAEVVEQTIIESASDEDLSALLADLEEYPDEA